MRTLDTSALDLTRLPQHVAIIMDGNGRWAQRRGLSRIEGHRRGKESVRAVVEAARSLGIPYLSVFAFSTENWRRPTREVNALMSLLRRYLRTEVKRLMKNEVQVRAIGDLHRLDAVRRELEDVVALPHNRSSSSASASATAAARTSSRRPASWRGRRRPARSIRRRSTSRSSPPRSARRGFPIPTC